jgi:hypothetical protein
VDDEMLLNIGDLELSNGIKGMMDEKITMDGGREYI